MHNRTHFMPKKSSIATKLRSRKTWRRYLNEPKRVSGACFMCGKELTIIKDYEYWALVENQFPYDAVASTHHMLVPRRHVATGEELTSKEGDELEEIMDGFKDSGYYDCILLNFPAAQSHPTHFHFHLLIWTRIIPKFSLKKLVSSFIP